MELLCLGWSNKAIAAELFIHIHTVGLACVSIYAKYGLSGRPEINKRVSAILRFLERKE